MYLKYFSVAIHYFSCDTKIKETWNEENKKLEKKQTYYIRLIYILGSIGSNGSGQGWSTQVEELAEHLAADFDGSLSALAASDLATAVASYTMR